MRRYLFMVTSILIIGCSTDEPNAEIIQEEFNNGVLGSWHLADLYNDSDSFTYSHVYSELYINESSVFWNDSLNFNFEYNYPEDEYSKGYISANGEFQFKYGNLDSYINGNVDMVHYLINGWDPEQTLSRSVETIDKINEITSVDFVSFDQMGVIVPEVPTNRFYEPDRLQRFIKEASIDPIGIEYIFPYVYNLHSSFYDQNPWPAVLSQDKDTLEFLAGRNKVFIRVK